MDDHSEYEAGHALFAMRRDAMSLICSLPRVQTPSLIVDEVTVSANIDATISLIGSVDRWRAHCKTARSKRTMRLLLDQGVRRFKASTTTEVACLLEVGAPDVLYAVTASGPAQQQLVDLAARYPESRVHALLDSETSLRSWTPGPVQFFIDVDTGMHRSGVSAREPANGRRLIDAAVASGFVFSGLHHYDGYLAGLPAIERRERVHDGLRSLSGFAAALGLDVPEIVTGGSHTFRAAVDFDFPPDVAERIDFSPGTVVYCDLQSLERLGDVGLRPAVAVLGRVISTPTAQIATVDVGLTAIQVDAGLPHAQVSGFPNAELGVPSQEHLGIRMKGLRPTVGQLLALIPRHVDTTIAQFDRYLAVDANGDVLSQRVDARHHSYPMSG